MSTPSMPLRLRYGAPTIAWTEDEVSQTHHMGRRFDRSGTWRALQFLLNAPKTTFLPWLSDEETIVAREHRTYLAFERYRQDDLRIVINRPISENSCPSIIFQQDEVEENLAYVGIHPHMQAPGAELHDATPLDPKVIRLLLVATLVRRRRSIPFSLAINCLVGLRLMKRSRLERSTAFDIVKDGYILCWGSAWGCAMSALFHPIIHRNAMPNHTGSRRLIKVGRFFQRFTF
ncbi:hypothetical protein BOTBODRAFT_556901 [Botryobasidium botryosum FD-172 SS1]|uniref:Uncharacterized protein n=1 Tax=Botryobasidium botryosum (strain FD-172 SS1) TaxID=930990 RepID=A0A067MAL7_BOTB1|nr:hypothetical protein BOTBODRAFT_556901 [Botryobasidium botryosum FD-172 SS1]